MNTEVGSVHPQALGLRLEVVDCRSVSAADCVCDCGEAVQWPNERKAIFFMQVSPGSGSVVLSGEFGTTASDLCQHVDQHFEIGGPYTFKQSMSLFVNWTLDDREQLLA